MTEQQQPENTVSLLDDLFVIIGRQTVENIKLREQLQTLAASYNEIGQENARLIKNAVTYENHIRDLEGELSRLKTLGPEAAAIADQADGIIQGSGLQPVDGSTLS